jgi:hypothetical protein
LCLFFFLFLCSQVKKWEPLRAEAEAARVQPDAPVYVQPPDAAKQPDLFDDDPSALDGGSVAARLVRVLGTMCGRLQHAWVLQAVLGMGKLLLGGSVDVNLKLACDAMVKLDEATLINALRDAKASMQAAGAAAAAAAAGSPGQVDKGAGAAKSGSGEPRMSDEELARKLHELVAGAVPSTVNDVFGADEVGKLLSSLVDLFQDEVRVGAVHDGACGGTHATRLHARTHIAV